MSLDKIYSDYALDSKLAHLRTPGIRLVPGAGPIRPLVMLVGEAPGAMENTHGKPFVGTSGRVLKQLMGTAGLYTEDTSSGGVANSFITNVVKYRPPNNRTPVEAEIRASRPYLRREWVELGGPRIIIGLGATAKLALLPSVQVGVSAMAGSPVLLGRKDKIWFWIMLHPAAVLYQRNLRTATEKHWEDLGRWLIRKKFLGATPAVEEEVEVR
jgi:uracil-DNA glycosylase family 4